MKDGAEVLKQRDTQLGKEIEDLKHKIDDLEDVLKQPEVRKRIVEIVRQKLAEAQDTNMDKKYRHQMKQLDSFLTMNNEEIDNYDRRMRVEDYKQNQSDYDDSTQAILEQPSIDVKDLELLLLHLVKRNRKISGEQI